ncbi:Hypothetical protein LLA12_00630 [Lactococcus lactis subsp. lactis]|nr:Hypothetical protein LLA12_00630 [Lactococcus lactis subsp. lactis]
MVWAINNDYIT